jgi:hypothetical protein
VDYGKFDEWLDCIKIFWTKFRSGHYLCTPLEKTEIVAQQVRAPDCGSGGRGFESPHSPSENVKAALRAWFLAIEAAFKICIKLI